MSAQQLFLGIISGQRQRDHAEVADRAARIAGGLQRLGVKPGDSVCILMRNDIAFLEAAYVAMRLGAYAVPVNWHFKPEEIDYVLKDSGTSVLIGHPPRADAGTEAPLSLSCAAAKNLHTLVCRAVSGASRHVIPDHAFRT
jgi:acyl-CoA synthetase (AMP-forming)/AMP-acid ligase II